MNPTPILAVAPVIIFESTNAFAHVGAHDHLQANQLMAHLTQSPFHWILATVALVLVWQMFVRNGSISCFQRDGKQTGVQTSRGSKGQRRSDLRN